MYMFMIIKILRHFTEITGSRCIFLIMLYFTIKKITGSPKNSVFRTAGSPGGHIKGHFIETTCFMAQDDFVSA